MKRRDFCTSALSTAVLAGLPASQLFAAATRAATKITGDVDAVTGVGGEVILPKSDVVDLSKSLSGQLLLPGNPAYDSARKLWNGMFDKHPALIAQCAGAADISRAVGFARANQLLVAVRGGGHSLSGKSSCDGGLMIDLSPMKGVRVDPAQQRARVEPGTLLRQFDREAQAFGLATTMGTDGGTGAAGLTLGGGFGRMARKYGLACDNLRSVDIVTADGRYLQASSEQNQDLFWALRGGGGNFGVVSSFEYDMHKLGPKVLGGTLMYPLSKIKEVVAFYSDYALAAPEEMNVSMVIVTLPNGRGFVGISVAYLGDIAQGEKLLKPLREFGKPMMDGIKVETYLALQDGGRGGGLPAGQNYYMKSGYMNELDPGLVDAVLEGFRADSKRSYVAVCSQLGGAINRVPENATAFPHRDGEFDFMVGASWKNNDYSEANVSYMRSLWKTIEPFTRDFYVNNDLEQNADKIRATYRGNFQRLQRIKNQYDPSNLFRLNANIKPSV